MNSFVKVFLIIIGSLMALAVVIGLLFLAIYPSTHHTQRTFTVKKMEVVADSSGNGHTYLIYTDQGTFEDVDSLINRKYNSSDLFGQLEAGKKYNCDTTGFRFQFSSSYPNLISCNEVK